MAQVLSLQSASSTAARAAPAQPLLGDILVRSGALAPGHLAEALTQQRQQDAPLGRILLCGGHISPDALADALSEQAGLGRLDLDATPPDRSLLAELDPYRCLELEAVPWRDFGGRRVIAVCNPARGAEAMRALGRAGEPMAVAIARPEAVRRVIAQHFGPQMVDRAERRCPEPLSCRALVSNRLTRRKAAGLAGIAGGIALAPTLALQIALAWILIASLFTTGLRLTAILARLRAGPPPPGSAAPRLVDYRRLPTVSILVPLSNEAAVAGQLVEALAAMAYPAPLLDIKLVLEAGDGATRAAIERAELPPSFEVITVPAGTIRTKPRAMNYALPFCRGDIVGVYDAEDRPDPGQIRAVVQHLMDADPKVACVQGYLDFYDAERNWLSRCFTIEYAVWFRVVLLGVQRMRLPIPLGGTTVFFRRRALEEIGAWDAHNVTEDADLGIRLARFGYRCEMIATTTAEEANAESAGRWIRQRSRWLKGYAITWATHMRSPRALLHDLGLPGFIGFQVLFLGGITSYLAMPLFWLLWAGTLGLDLPVPGVTNAFLAVMLAGQAVMLLTACIALIDCGRRRMLPWVASLVFYWPLGALAAYRAIAEVFYAPFLWHKTEHGRNRDHQTKSAAAGGPRDRSPDATP